MRCKLRHVKKILAEFRLKIEHIHDPYITKISSGHTDMLIDKFAKEICQLFKEGK